MQIIALSFSTAFLLTYFAIPSIIRVALAKNLCDEPGERRSHSVRTPSLGGIGIFAGSIFSIVLWTPFAQFGNLQYILCAFIILFLIGAKDDIYPLAVHKKIIAQCIAASILVIKSDISLQGMYGLFGLHQTFPEWASYILSVLTLLFILNAFNLLDGIDALAVSTGILILGTLGSWFFMAGRMEFAILAFATTGSIVAFLRYNITPAKIFMGDTGSLLIGMVTAILVIKFIDLNYALPTQNPARFENAPVVAMGIIILPLFDTLRVMVLRIARGTSPFQADRHHIHHLMIDYGFSHVQASGILVFVNAAFIVLTLALHNLLELHVLLLLVFALALALALVLQGAVHRKHLALHQKPLAE